jgi:hypothetical protein
MNGSAHERAMLDRYNLDQRELGEAEIVPGASAEHLLQSEVNAAKTGNNGKGGGSGGEAYERIPALDKRLMQFQQYLASAPTQCVRYDYGGTPMWPAKVRDETACLFRQVRTPDIYISVNYFVWRVVFRCDLFVKVPASNSCRPYIC